MANSLYDQLGRGLGQSVRYWGRSILYRGKIIPCMMDFAAVTNTLDYGGIRIGSNATVKIPRELVPRGADGEPRANETVTYPAYETRGIMPADYIIGEIVSDEFSYSFELSHSSK
jgi:hypothetical protein